jgi:hypothetical protein
MGSLGRGRGGLAPERQTGIGFKIERGKVHTGRGAIIGQIRFDGEQVKGDVSSSFAEVVTAAERDASDRINRDRVPRQYQKAVKAYFSNVQRSVRGANRVETDSESGPDATTDEGSAVESNEQTSGEADRD